MRSKLENYVKTIGIEARTLAEMITKDFLPAVSTYAAEVSKNAAAKKSFMAAADTASEEALVEKTVHCLHCSDCRGNRTENPD